MTPSPITTPLVIGWVLTGLGILVSLSWNVFNQVKAGQTAGSLRIEQYRSSQWIRIRGTIDSTLSDFVDAGGLILRQAEEMDPTRFTAASSNFLQTALIDAQDNLAAALEEASKSKYCEGGDWSNVANGPLVGTETAWDTVLAVLAEANAANSKLELISALAKLRPHVASIRRSVLDRCREQDLQLDPERL